MTHSIPLYSILPFILLLLSIAIFPLFSNNFWSFNKNKLIVAVILSVPTALWLILSGFSSELIKAIIFDYLPFIILLASLYIISGGIFIDGDIEAKPEINTLILATGAVLASLIGTTGAAMLLIRLVLHTNKERKYKVHSILFFIAIVANCGGLLTPLGDPPLFMLYLRGVSFFWFLNLIPEWLFTNAILLVIFFFIDKYYWKKEPDKNKNLEKSEQMPIVIRGKLNFLWLLGVILAVALINGNSLSMIAENHYYAFIREGVIILMAVLSLIFTTKTLRKSNKFTWGPIEEVAYLFLGIFITLVPCILYLEQNANQLGISSSVLYYYATGTLSSFLDNTPTAITFYSLAKGLVSQTPSIISGVPIVGAIPENIMKAICVSAVYFGSLTYIGNGPNLMIKSIAEANNVDMPHFFEYIYKFSLLILLPVFILVQLLFIW